MTVDMYSHHHDHMHRHTFRTRLVALGHFVDHQPVAEPCTHSGRLRAMVAPSQSCGDDPGNPLEHKAPVLPQVTPPHDEVREMQQRVKSFIDCNKLVH